MSAPCWHKQLCPELWRCILEQLPLWQRAICCRVCKAWEKDLEKTVDYGVATLCSLLAQKGATRVLRLLLRVHRQGIPADLGRLDQVRRFLERHRDREMLVGEMVIPKESRDPCIVSVGNWVTSVDNWVQLASQEPDRGWLCDGAKKKMMMEGRNRVVMMRVEKPQDCEQVMDPQEVESDEVESDEDDEDESESDEDDEDESDSDEDAGDKVTLLVLSPDNKTLASASDDRGVKSEESSQNAP